MFFQDPYEKSIEQIIDDLQAHPIIHYFNNNIGSDNEDLKILSQIKHFLTQNEDLMELN